MSSKDAAAPAVAGVAIAAAGLRKVFDGGLVVGVERADLRVAAGERVAIVGPTGCGKSTLLALLALLERPDAGELRLDGVDARELGSGEAWRAANVGIVFQLHHLLPHLTVRENVELALVCGALPAAERRCRTAALLEQLALAYRAETLAARLSGGERQLVALARALANRPRLILADEPTGAVDSATGRLLLAQLLGGDRTPRPTIVLVTHDPAVAAIADRVVAMRDGTLAA